MSEEPSNYRALARRLGLGRAMFLMVHNPRNVLRRINRVGWRQSWRARRGEDAMLRAARTLPAIPNPGSGEAEVSFLTGARFWHQTMFCAWSLCQSSGRSFHFALYDDGTLRSEHTEPFHRIFPGRVRVVQRSEVEAHLDKVLPVRRYPTLRQRRIVYPNLRKLTDIHAGGEGWKLVLDSDMLFFSRPTEILDWIDQPPRALLMQDVESSYGYPQELIERIAGVAIPPKLNVGVCGLQSEAIDFDLIESWQRELIASRGTSYYEEQALIAMMASRNGFTQLSADYICAPTKEEALAGSGVLQHYVADSKAWYFESSWRCLLERYR